MEKISGIYKITNTVTGDFYIGSSKNVKLRWANHKISSTWDRCPNNPLYKDMKKYGVDKFEFQILAEVEANQLKEKEQWFIETLKPTYNNYNASGWNVEKYKKHKKEYQKEYHNSDKYKEYKNGYNNQLCCYNGEKMTLAALSTRFRRAGIEHSTIEAKKYLLEKEPNNAIDFC